MLNYSVQAIYEKLYEHYGPQDWWPAETPFEMMIGSILVQRTNWKNAEKALVRLSPYMKAELLEEMPTEKLAELIRSSGFYQLKAKRIKAFVTWFNQHNNDIEKLKTYETEKLREELLNVYGIGRETADVMLLYAFEKPVFVVDAYARRIFYRLGLNMPTSYDAFRHLVEKELPADVELFNEYHALIVTHAQQICKKKPRCKQCPLAESCEKRGVE